MDFETINPLWRLADPLTVQQAAALVAGFDPNAVRFNAGNAAWFENDAGLTDSGSISWVQTAFAALTNAILAGKLIVKVVHDSRAVDDADTENFVDTMECGSYFNPGFEIICGNDERFSNGYFIKNAPSWERTMIGVDVLRGWLESKGFGTGFFFPTATDAPDYLDSKNPRYAPKLAASVRAWQAVTDPGKKSAKKALEKWLRENAAQFGLVDDDGSPVNQAVEDCSKVANWNQTGGAPKTPVG